MQSVHCLYLRFEELLLSRPADLGRSRDFSGYDEYAASPTANFEYDEFAASPSASIANDGYDEYAPSPTASIGYD